jgi:hypothetical protein
LPQGAKALSHRVCIIVFTLAFAPLLLAGVPCALDLTQAREASRLNLGEPEAGLILLYFLFLLAPRPFKYLPLLVALQRQENGNLNSQSSATFALVALLLTF